MANEFLVITGSICLIVALVESWMIVAVLSKPDGGLATLIPGSDDLLRSHIDFLMMSQFLFIFYMLFSHFHIAAAAVIIFCMCLGSFGNALLFLIRAINPALKEPPVAFRIVMFISCSMTTIGYLSGAWLVARSAFTLI